jgi:GalNAc-alpha-(1->4)-GalNAc-alpha-(1->3)-diNAcBac-PP-undecaprenol alpha-1,4-N-acetyl-D-galactosaminyltransferase
MKNILFTIHSLRGGGAERILSTLANHLVENNFNFTILTIDKADSAYEISTNIKIIELGLNSNNVGTLFSIKNFIYRIKAVYQKFAEVKPDLCISFMTETNIISIISSKIIKIPVIVSERTNPYKHKISIVYSFLRNVLYKYANSVIVQTESVSKYYKLNNINIIPNFIKINHFNPLNLERGNTILSVGRLSEEKGHSMLLDAYALSNAIKFGWKLKIVGTGPLKDHLLAKSKHLKIDNNVEFEGKSSNVYANLINAGIFVLPSNYEGFPNALMEALSVGVPSISTDCDYGPSELIQDGLNGLLVKVGDVNELKDQINNLINDTRLRDRFRLEGPKSMKKFDYEIVISKWNTLINEIIKN